MSMSSTSCTVFQYGNEWYATCLYTGKTYRVIGGTAYRVLCAPVPVG